MSWRLVLSTVLVLHGLAGSASAAPTSNALGAESIDQALCRLIESSAHRHGLPVGFLTRLIWRESSFRPDVVSPAGAQGVAQFMPRTAGERGLADPFDPEQAIPEAAEFLAELWRRFGNLGLAAAAYNGGPARVSNWLEGRGELPGETRAYVLMITDQAAEDWAAAAKAGTEEDTHPEITAPASCLTVVAVLRKPGSGTLIAEAPWAPWGVQLAGNFSKQRALASFARARARHTAVIGEVRPMVVGTRLRSRGTRPFYRVRVPAASRAAATELCNRIRSAGGSCIVLPS